MLNSVDNFSNKSGFSVPTWRWLDDSLFIFLKGSTHQHQFYRGY